MFGNTHVTVLVVVTLGLVLASAGIALAEISMVADAYLGSEGLRPSYFCEFNNELYFQASNPTSNIELWKYDGSAISQVADIRPGVYESKYGEMRA